MNSYLGEGSCYGRDTRHTVEAYLQWDDYKGTVMMQIDGNCYGADILGSVMNMIEDGDYKPVLPNQDLAKHVRVDSEGLVREYVLYRDNGDSMAFEPEDIGDSVIGVVITNCEDIDETVGDL